MVDGSAVQKPLPQQLRGGRGDLAPPSCCTAGGGRAGGRGPGRARPAAAGDGDLLRRRQLLQPAGEGAPGRRLLPQVRAACRRPQVPRPGLPHPRPRSGLPAALRRPRLPGAPAGPGRLRPPFVSLSAGTGPGQRGIPPLGLCPLRCCPWVPGDGGRVWGPAGKRRFSSLLAAFSRCGNFYTTLNVPRMSVRDACGLGRGAGRIPDLGCFTGRFPFRGQRPF